MSGSKRSDQQEWKYPEQPSKVKASGAFNAFHAVTDNAKGESAVAWVIKVHDSGDEAYSDARKSDASDSGEERAYLAGVAGTLEALQPHSTVKIHSHAEYVVRGLNEWIEGWATKNWKGVANADIWRRIYRVWKERQLQVSGEHCPKGKNPHIPTFEMLAARAKKLIE